MMSGAAPPDCPQWPRLARLLALLRRDDVGAAIEAGLMDFTPCPPSCACAAEAAVILETRQRLQAAWAARERYRSRQMRLARRAAEREARRLPAADAARPEKPALPAAAAAILARAKARAAGRPTG